MNNSMFGVVGFEYNTHISSLIFIDFPDQQVLHKLPQVSLNQQTYRECNTVLSRQPI